MQPNMQKGDLIFVVEEGRFSGDAAVEGTGVVTGGAPRKPATTSSVTPETSSSFGLTATGPRRR